MRPRLLNSIEGRGAFRYFRDTDHDLGIADAWYVWREDAFRGIAIEWLEEHSVNCIDKKTVISDIL